MPTYEVTVGGQVLEVESDRPLTLEEAVSYALGAQPPEEEEDDRGLLARFGPTAIRAVGGTVAGVVGAVPSPLTTPAALAIGGGTEALAEAAEVATGEREALSPAEIATEAGLSAVPLGRFAKAGIGAGRAALRGAGRVAAVEAAGAQARSLARTGELASPEETATAAALGGAFGAAGGALEARLTRAPKTGGAVEEAVAEAAPEAAELPPLGQRRVILPEERAAVPPTEPVKLFGPDGKVLEEATPILEERPTVAVERALADEVVARADAAAQAIGSLPENVRKERFFRQLSAAIKDDLFDPTETARVLRRGGYTVDDFFKREVEPMFTQFERDISESGKKLNTVSREKKAVVAAMRRDPELRKLVDGYAAARKEAAGDSMFGRLWQEVLDVDESSRVTAIGQMATSHRNFISQLGRLLLEPPTDLVKNVLPSRFGGVRGNPLATLYGVVSAATPGDTTKVLGILERLGPEGDVLAQELFGRAAAEAGTAGARPIRGLPARMAGTFRDAVRQRRVMKAILGPISDAAGAYNQLSESFGRRAAFQARLMQRASAKEHAWQDVVERPDLLSADDFEDATRHALDVTFAASPESVTGKRFVNLVRSLGPIGSTFVTFPRYMVNAGKFLMDFNPAGALRLLDETKLEKRGADIAARAVVGTSLLGAAYLFRASRYAGERWYEGAPGGPEGDERTNLLGLAGPAIPYLALGEMVYRQVHGDEGRPPFTPQDLLQGSIGLRLSPGAQAVLEAMGTRTEEGWEKWYRAAERSVGEYVGRFTVPLRTIKDFAAAYGDDSEAIYYDPREVVELGGVRTTAPSATIQSVPELGEALERPAAVSSLTGRERRGEFTALRQLTGLTKLRRTAIEKEFARLGLSEFETFKPTGFPKADREIARRVGAIADQLTPALIESESYQGLGDAERKGVWDEFFKEASREAREDLKATNPAIADVLTTARNVPKTQRDILRETEGLDVDEILFQAVREAPENSFIQPGLREVEPPPAPERDVPSPRAAGTKLELQGLVRAEAEAQGVDPMLALAVAEQESRFNPRAVSGAGAQGLMQLMPVTAEEMGVDDPFDPEQNARGGVRYLKQLLDRFKSVKLALAAYNAGPARVARLGRVPNIKETKDYVRQVLERAERFTEEAR